MKPDTNLGKDARYKELSDGQATSYHQPQHSRAKLFVLEHGYGNIEAACSLGLVQSAMRRRVDTSSLEKGRLTS